MALDFVGTPQLGNMHGAYVLFIVYVLPSIKLDTLYFTSDGVYIKREPPPRHENPLLEHAALVFWI